MGEERQATWSKSATPDSADLRVRDGGLRREGSQGRSERKTGLETSTSTRRSFGMKRDSRILVRAA
jgi:hypothetical protein